MAILTNNITGVSVEVHATTEHPDSSYGIPVIESKVEQSNLQLR